MNKLYVIRVLRHTGSHCRRLNPVDTTQATPNHQCLKTADNIERFYFVRCRSITIVNYPLDQLMTIISDYMLNK